MIRRALLGMLAATVFVAGVPAVAAAQTDREPPSSDRPVVSDEARADSFDRAKAHVIKRIERRLATLDRLTRKIEKAKHLTAEHAAVLLRDVAAARETLRAGSSMSRVRISLP